VFELHATLPIAFKGVVFSFTVGCSLFTALSRSKTQSDTSGYYKTRGKQLCEHSVTLINCVPPVFLTHFVLFFIYCVVEKKNTSDIPADKHATNKEVLQLATAIAASRRKKRARENEKWKRNRL